MGLNRRLILRIFQNQLLCLAIDLLKFRLAPKRFFENSPDSSTSVIWSIVPFPRHTMIVVPRDVRDELLNLS